MDYSIKPSKAELRELRQRAENAVSSYQHFLDLDRVEFNLGWQQLENDSTVVSGDGTLTVVVQPGAEAPKLEKKLLRGMLELEFVEEAPYDEISFNWQEVLKLAYVQSRTAEILDEERAPHPELEAPWPDLSDELGKRTGEFSDEFYVNAAALGEAIGQELLEKHDIDKLPDLKKTDVEDAGDRLYR